MVYETVRTNYSLYVRFHTQHSVLNRPTHMMLLSERKVAPSSLNPPVKHSQRFRMVQSTTGIATRFQTPVLFNTYQLVSDMPITVVIAFVKLNPEQLFVLSHNVLG
jgi:hypothetical protein